MTRLAEATEKSAGRLKGVVEAGREGNLAMVAATVAGTDLSGVELAGRIGVWSDGLVEDFRSMIEEWEHGPQPSDEAEAAALLAGLFRDFIYRRANGTALYWFWTGYEMRRLQEWAE